MGRRRRPYHSGKQNAALIVWQLYQMVFTHHAQIAASYNEVPSTHYDP